MLLYLHHSESLVEIPEKPRTHCKGKNANSRPYGPGSYRVDTTTDGRFQVVSMFRASMGKPLQERLVGVYPTPQEAERIIRGMQSESKEKS